MAKRDMQRRVKRARRSRAAKYTAGSGVEWGISYIERDVSVPEVDLSAYDEKLENALAKGRVEVGLFFGTRRQGGKDSRMTNEVREILHQQGDLLNEIIHRRSKEY